MILAYTRKPNLIPCQVLQLQFVFDTTYIRFQSVLLLVYCLFSSWTACLPTLSQMTYSTQVAATNAVTRGKAHQAVSRMPPQSSWFQVESEFSCVCVCGWKEVSWAVPPSEAWVGDQPLLKMETFLLHTAFYQSILHLCCIQDTRCKIFRGFL